MEELKEIFEGWGDIFSKESERPYSEDYDSAIDHKYFLNQIDS